MSKVLLKIWYSCNHNCIFCHAEENKIIKDEWSLNIIKKIIYIKKNFKDIDTIIFSWGEPTMQKNFFKLLELSNWLWFNTWIVTNWSLIYEEKFLDKCLNFNLKYIYLSIHWWSEHLQNTITKAKNSFSQIKKLLNLIKKTDINILLNCVVTKYNIDSLDEIIEFIRQNWNPKIKFSLLEPKWLGLTQIDKLYVSPHLVSEKIQDVIKKYPETNIAWDGLPLCLIKRYEKKVCNLQSEGIMYISENYEDIIYKTDFWVRDFSNKCNFCNSKKSCYWNYKIYNELYWGDFLNPIN